MQSNPLLNIRASALSATTGLGMSTSIAANQAAAGSQLQAAQAKQLDAKKPIPKKPGSKPEKSAADKGLLSVTDSPALNALLEQQRRLDDLISRRRADVRDA
eukprot:CAMPEP_0202880920 /NCGR_PEP_ID=MMETSP1391-20130828/35751_1 /ASSEMBLY_ACC=CAM_ASM_000867 /TAXON_ID=1034604 /ORGANISM="Chlamydomonas leiostraca, Strain SAG 11-49" /LENGTH=101 /DNA_ID=CAMNT_0049563499 /DNA_START=19 /DNA_END=321 /DNA_ORIENTATION=-